MATLWGNVSDLYKGRVKARYDQLDYGTELIMYPEVQKKSLNYVIPKGATTYSGAGTATGASNLMQIVLNTNGVADPKSFGIYFQCQVQGAVGNATPASIVNCAGLANFAHSVFADGYIQFQGTASVYIEQIVNYNVFCSMLYQLMAQTHLERIGSNLIGWTPLTYVGNTTTNGPLANFNAGTNAYGYFSEGSNRIWGATVATTGYPVQGPNTGTRSFMLPLNFGFFNSN